MWLTRELDGDRPLTRVWIMAVLSLDGSEVISLLLDARTAERYRELMAQPAAGMIGLVVAWNLIGFVLDPVHTLALNLLYPGAGYH